MIGQQVTVFLALDNEQPRCFDGMISRFGRLGEGKGGTTYQGKMVPWLWFLTKRTNCRIFQDKKIPDIIEQVFKELGFNGYYRFELTNSYEPRDYCVQYGETDYTFVSRLMEQYGMYYFFEHKMGGEKGKHTLVITDNPSFRLPCPGHERVKWKGEADDSQYEPGIVEILKEQEFHPGKFCHIDFNFTTPKNNLSSKEQGHFSVGKDKEYEVYEYPGEYVQRTEGESLAKIRMQEKEAMHTIIRGKGTCKGFMAGAHFELVGYDHADLSGAYRLLLVKHKASTGDSDGVSWGAGMEEGYRNFFICTPLTVPFRPARKTPKPAIQGPQTAIVVGKSGEEIQVDKYGRVKVQFHWDREGKSDDYSSCWVRVMQQAAGKQWGTMFLPRIGQEVVVEFLNGDPDQPLITGSVYNAENMPPYPLPANQTRTTIKSNSSKGGGGSNELRFEDKSGSEEIYLHGQKDWTIVIGNDQTQTIANDKTLSVGKNRTKTVGVDESETIGANKTITVGANHSENIGSNETITVGMAAAETIGLGKALSIGGAYQVSVGAAMNETIGGAKAEEIGGLKSVNVGALSSEKVAANKSVDAGGSIKETAKKDISIKAGQNITLDAGKQIVLKTGKASITMKDNGDITIKGKKITVKGTGNIVIKGKKVLEN